MCVDTESERAGQQEGNNDDEMESERDQPKIRQPRQNRPALTPTESCRPHPAHLHPLVPSAQSRPFSETHSKTEASRPLHPSQSCLRRGSSQGTIRDGRGQREWRPVTARGTSRCTPGFGAGSTNSRGCSRAHSTSWTR